MSIPDYQTLMLPVLRHASKGKTHVRDCAESIADSMGVSEVERDELLPSGRQRVLHNRIHWAKFYLSKAGLIESPSRGVFVATAKGREFLNSNPAELSTELLKNFPAFAEFYSKYSKSSTDTVESEMPAAIVAAQSSSTPEEQIDAASTVLISVLKTEILQRVVAQSPGFFERVIVDLLVAMGYGGSHDRAALRLGKGGDGGVDGVIDEDRLGLDRIYVQAKRYASQVVGRPEVQGFVGSLVGLGATKGVFVTTSTFSSHAIEYVRHLPQRVILIDGDRLADLLVEHDVGARVARTIKVKRIDEDFFLED